MDPADKLRFTTLDVFQAGSVARLQRALYAIGALEDDTTARGANYFNGCYCYRQLAVYEILAYLDRSRSASYLCKSALMRRQMLHHWRRDLDYEPLTVCASRNRSFVDAIVAGAFDVATELAQLAPSQPMLDVEYEEDFFLFHSMHQLFLMMRGEKHADVEPILESWDDVAVEPQPYLDVLRAILSRDAGKFGETMQVLIDERTMQMDDLLAARGRENEFFITESSVFLTGLALIRLAGLVKIEVLDRYAMMPVNVLVDPGEIVLAEQDWRHIETGMPVEVRP